MSNTYFQLYLKDIYRLVETLVIKSETSAVRINEQLTWMGIEVDPVNPHSWKYYLNLSGVYHHTDNEMMVTSIDTLEPILFDKDNLRSHRATAREYAYGSHYYNTLVAKYPEQEMLILGILDPVDIDVAISAPDHTILHYDKKLVEENEYTLISGLQYWIHAFVARWHNGGYDITDDLYHASMLGVLFLNLPLTVLNLRFERCNTAEVHTFHIHQYLASNGNLDRYLPTLTKKQALFLYRNIRYIHRNAGRNDTLKLLTEKLLTDRGLPLSSYEVMQDHEYHLRDLYSKPGLQRHPMNFIPITPKTDLLTVRQVLEKGRSQGASNTKMLEDNVVDIEERLKLTVFDTHPTKMLESVVRDRSDSSPYPLSDLLLNNWLFLSSTRRYQTYLSIPNPKTGIHMALQAKDAFIIFLYAFNAQHDIRLPEIPLLEARGVRRPVRPTREELRSVVDPKYVTEELIELAMEDQPGVGFHTSTDSFLEACVESHEALLRHHWLYTQQEHFTTRGQLEQMVGYFYQDVACDLGAGENYDLWFVERGLNIAELSAMECGLLARDILKHATGFGLGTGRSLREIQASMLRLMGELSSYSVQFLKSINSEAVQLQEWLAIRMGDHRGKGYHQWLVDVARVRVLEHRASGFAGMRIETSEFGFDYLPKIVPKHKISFDPGIDHDMTDASITHHYRVDIDPVDVLQLNINTHP